MHVLHIMAARGQGGAETYFGDLVRCLQEAGVRQTAVVRENYFRRQELIDSGVSVHTEPLSIPIIPLQRLRIGRLIAGMRDKPDLVHTWMRRGATLVPQGLSCPIISWSGGYYPVDKLKKRATHFVGITPDILRHFRDGGIPEGQMSLQPTFPLLDANMPAAPRGSLDTPTEAPLLLTLARLHRTKGLDTLFKSLVALPGYWLWLAGAGELEGSFRQLARTLGISDRVRFLGWRQDRAALLKAADILVVPSRSEAFGTVLLEGWAMQKPVVASAWPHTVIVHEKTGLLTPIDDVEGLTDTIRRAFVDKALAARVVANAYAEFKTNWSPKVSTRRMIALYEALRSTGQQGGVIGRAPLTVRVGP